MVPLVSWKSHWVPLGHKKAFLGRSLLSITRVKSFVIIKFNGFFSHSPLPIPQNLNFQQLFNVTIKVSPFINHCQLLDADVKFLKI